MPIPRRLLLLAALAAAPAAAAAQAPLPLTHTPRPTSAAISPADLMTRVYAFAADSMGGREAGTPFNLKGADYIARELRRMGLEPAGENGTFFQDVPLVRRPLAEGSTLSLDGTALRPWTDFAPRDQGAGARSLNGAPVVFGGTWGDAGSLISDAQAAGKIVLLLPARGPDGRPTWQMSRAQVSQRFPSAAGIAVASLDLVPAPVAASYRQSGITLSKGGDAPAAPAFLYVTAEAARRMLGAAPESAVPGAAGRTLAGGYQFREERVPGRNVIAVLRGGDARLRNQYVAIGAHNDHVGFSSRPVDHDSLRLFNRLFRPGGADQSAPRELTAEQTARLRAGLDSVRRLRPARLDSVYNGADDDASGSMGLLEIAEALATARPRPRRSILFVWHTAEELGLYGSEHFTEHPTVPLDSVVTQLNVDMIGRGSPADVAGGGPGYVQLIGSRRLSTQLGALVETVNREKGSPMRFDYAFDANGHPQQYYCRSDHYNYARFGIPVTFFSTGGHQDYHMLSDEPQYLDYAQLARVTGFIRDVAVRVANLDARPVVDQPVIGPDQPCVQ